MKEQNKQTTISMERSEVARWAAAAAIENKEQKDELSQRIASKEAAAKIKNDYIESIQNGVLSRSIKSVLPD